MAISGTDDSGASESDDNEDHHSENMDEVCFKSYVLEMGRCLSFLLIALLSVWKQALRVLGLPVHFA
jgi:hypothetical protein